MSFRTAATRLGKPQEELVGLREKLLINSSKNPKDAATKQMAEECAQGKDAVKSFIESCLSEIAEYEMTPESEARLILGSLLVMVARMFFPPLLLLVGGFHSVEASSLW